MDDLQHEVKSAETACNSSQTAWKLDCTAKMKIGSSQEGRRGLLAQKLINKGICVT